MCEFLNFFASGPNESRKRNSILQVTSFPMPKFVQSGSAQRHRESKQRCRGNITKCFHEQFSSETRRGGNRLSQVLPRTAYRRPTSLRLRLARHSPSSPDGSGITAEKIGQTRADRFEPIFSAVIVRRSDRNIRVDGTEGVWPQGPPRLRRPQISGVVRYRQS